MSSRSDVVLVTGATGHVGSHVVAELRNMGAHVRALTRNPASANLPNTIEVVRGDLAAPNTLAQSLVGVAAVFLVWPFSTAEAAPAIVDLLKQNVRRVVYLSSLGVQDQLAQQRDPINQFHADIERLIRQSGLGWSFVRPSGFATNTFMWRPQIQAGNVVRWPFAAAARSLIHERDIAAVAVHALTQEQHQGATYLLSGPEAITQAEQVRMIGAAIGRQLHYQEISRAEARQQMLRSWPPTLVDGALDAWAEFVVQPEQVTSTVADITGVAARTFREWTHDHDGDFR